MVGVDIFYLNMAIRKPVIGFDYQNRQGSFISNVDDFLDQDMTGKSKESIGRKKYGKSSFRTSRISDYQEDIYDLGGKRSSKCIVKFYLILSALGGLIASIGIIGMNAFYKHKDSTSGSDDQFW